VFERATEHHLGVVGAEGRRLPGHLLDPEPSQHAQQPVGLGCVGLGDEHVAAGPQPDRVGALDGQAGLGEGA
jgi:hypothetical protein